MGYVKAPSQEVTDLCKALGLDPQRITSMHLTIGLHDIITLNVTRLVMDEELEELTRVLTKYGLKATVLQ